MSHSIQYQTAFRALTMLAEHQEETWPVKFHVPLRNYSLTHSLPFHWNDESNLKRIS